MTTTPTTSAPLLNLTIDYATGAVRALGRNGRLYTPAEVEAALDGAARGDADARATLAALDHTGVDPGAGAHGYDDCPLCRAEREARRDEHRARARARAAAASTAGDGDADADADADPTWWHGRRPRRRGRR